MKIYNQLQNQKGMSLVGVVVAGGIGLLVMMGMTDMIGNGYKSQRAIQAKDAGREVYLGIHSLLSDPAACASSFATLGPITAPNVVPATVIKNAAGTTAMYSVNDVKLNLVKITGFDIKNYDNVKKTAVLSVKMDKLGSTIGGAQMVNDIQLNVTVDGTDKIVKCNALGSADSLWQLAANNADIYFNGGSVGIGTTSPAMNLSVVSNTTGNLSGLMVQTSDTHSIYLKPSQVATGDNPLTQAGDQQIIFSNGSINTGNLVIGPWSNTTGTGVRITNTGDVGIGVAIPNAKLEVNGGVALKTATAQPLCNSTRRGTLWFTQVATAGVADQFEVCAKQADGTYAWSSGIGGGGGGGVILQSQMAATFGGHTSVNFNIPWYFDASSGTACFPGNCPVPKTYKVTVNAAGAASLVLVSAGSCAASIGGGTPIIGGLTPTGVILYYPVLSGSGGGTCPLSYYATMIAGWAN